MNVRDPEAGTLKPDTPMTLYRAGRRAFLAAMSRRRGGRVCHYTEVLDGIEGGIVPLVRAFDSALTTPIFSCEGHWECRSEPYVTFLVLPGCRQRFGRFLVLVLNETPPSLACFQFVHRHCPRRGGNGPFIDWKVSLHVPFGTLTSPEDYGEFRRTTVTRLAGYFRKQIRRSEP
jgi:hypothetical protein